MEVIQQFQNPAYTYERTRTGEGERSMSNNIDALFAGMAKADASGRGGSMDVGLYTVETKNILVKKGQDPKKPGDIFIVEFTVVESDNEKHKPGTSGSWVLRFAWPATFGHITKFLYACLANTDPDAWAQTKANLDDPAKRELAERYARAICGSDTAKKELGAEYEDGMFLGVRLKLETKLQKTSPKPGQPLGGDFTAYFWGPGEDADSAAA